MRVLADKMAGENFLVASAGNGQEGLRMALQETPDLIILDLVMPKMDGIEVLKNLRRDPRGKNVPVIVLSNLNNAQSMDESLASGAQDFLVKVNNSLEDITRAVKSRLKI